MPVRKKQISHLLFLTANRKSAKYVTTLFQNSPKSRPFTRFFVYYVQILGRALYAIFDIICKEKMYVFADL